MEPERSFLNLARIQCCRWSFHIGVVHETVNVVDLGTSVWIDLNTSFHSICVCHVLCCKEVLQGLSRTSCNSLIPAICKKSLVQSIFLVSLFAQGTTSSVCVLQVSRGLACAVLSWPGRQELHRADEPVVVQSASSHHPWILQPRLRPQKCSRPDSEGRPLKQGYNWKSSSSFVIVNNVNRKLLVFKGSVSSFKFEYRLSVSCEPDTK